MISPWKLQEKFKKAADNLLQVSSVTDTKAQMLVQAGVQSIGDLSALTAANIAEFLEIPEEEAQAILQDTLDAIEKGEIQLDIEEEEELISASAIPAYRGAIAKGDEENKEDDEKGKFSDAEKRLREELAAFKLK